MIQSPIVDVRQKITDGDVTARELAAIALRLAFNERIGALFDQFDFVLLPVAPVSSLENGADHGPVREKILRYTTPGSVAGPPCVVLPNEKGGCQLLGPSGGEAKLLAFATRLALTISG
jgi:Asp-tRNA(Asn)/Glu-tRNA(Gln) amidotransferase A subunit family amidase